MIEAKQVRYGIRSREILRGVDFRVEKGEFVGLIGPNGSGKSTFLKNVYKVLRPQAGELTLMGDDLLAMSNRPSGLPSWYRSRRPPSISRWRRWS